jgi:hypothetical protein
VFIGTVHSALKEKRGRKVTSFVRNLEKGGRKVTSFVRNPEKGDVIRYKSGEGEER